MTPNADMTAPETPMPPNGDMARTHLITAADSLRVASERLCDYVEATMGDINSAPNADTGGARSVPTQPPIPRGAVVEVEGRVWTRTEDGWDDGHEFEYATWQVGRTLTALYHARREREEARERIAELEAQRREWPSQEVRVLTAERDVTRHQLRVAQERGALTVARLTARKNRRLAKMAEQRDEARARVAELEQERAEANGRLVAAQGMARDARASAAQMRAHLDNANAARDAARRELAAVKDQGLGASAISSRQAPNSEELDCGSAVASPAPASAPLSDPAPLSGAGNPADSGKPRRWWLNEYPHGMGYAHDTRGVADSEASSNRIACVPVIEARVTRETVAKVEGIVREARGTSRTSEHWAYEILRSLGFTITEEAGNG